MPGTYISPAETGFYYLQSRYYDPKIGRFINADQFTSTGQDFLGYNMFAYCNNNPINFVDHTGNAPTIIIGAAIGAAFSILTDSFTAIVNHEEYSLSDVMASAIGGAVSGGALTLGASVTLASTIGAAAKSATAGILAGDSVAKIAGDTLFQSAIAAGTAFTLGKVGKMAHKYLSGKYYHPGLLGDIIKEITYEPLYLNNKSVSTVAADYYWDWVKTTATNAIKGIIIEMN